MLIELVIQLIEIFGLENWFTSITDWMNWFIDLSTHWWIIFEGLFDRSGWWPEDCWQLYRTNPFRLGMFLHVWIVSFDVGRVARLIDVSEKRAFKTENFPISSTQKKKKYKKKTFDSKKANNVVQFHFIFV